MNKEQILNNLMNIARQPFMFFTDGVTEKGDNAFETLHLLSKEEKVTAGRIAEYLDIKPSSVTQIIKKLEDAGTAMRVKSEEDARVTYVLITEKGLDSLNDRGSIATDLKDELFKGFRDDELDCLDSYLTCIVSNIDSEEFNMRLDEIFGDDRRWKQFSKMSSHFGRAREQMMNDRGFYRGMDRDGNFWGRGRR